MPRSPESVGAEEVRLRPHEWLALAGGVLVGGLVGAAAGGQGSGRLWPALVGAVIGASAAGTCLLGHRLGAGTGAIGLAAGIVTGLEGLLLTALALRGDDEAVDALVGTTAMAVVLGLVCAAVTGLLLDGDEGEEPTG